MSTISMEIHIPAVIYIHLFHTRVKPIVECACVCVCVAAAYFEIMYVMQRMEIIQIFTTTRIQIIIYYIISRAARFITPGRHRVQCATEMVVGCKRMCNQQRQRAPPLFTLPHPACSIYLWHFAFKSPNVELFYVPPTNGHGAKAPPVQKDPGIFVSQPVSLYFVICVMTTRRCIRRINYRVSRTGANRIEWFKAYCISNIREACTFYASTTERVFFAFCW